MIGLIDGVRLYNDLHMKPLAPRLTLYIAQVRSDSCAVLGIRDILVGIRIPGSLPLTNGSGSDSFLQ
jgi:hypothetical protein